MVRFADKLLDLATIEAAEASATPYVLNDGGGLFVLVAPDGTKVFQFESVLNDKQYIVRIGAYPEFTLNQARLKAREHKRFVENEKNNLTASFDYEGDATPLIHSPVNLKKLSGINQKYPSAFLNVLRAILDKTPLDDYSIGRAIKSCMIFISRLLKVFLYWIYLPFRITLSTFRIDHHSAKIFHKSPLKRQVRLLRYFVRRMAVYWLKKISVFYRYLQSKVGFF